MRNRTSDSSRIYRGHILVFSFSLLIFLPSFLHIFCSQEISNGSRFFFSSSFLTTCRTKEIFNRHIYSSSVEKFCCRRTVDLVSREHHSIVIEGFVKVKEVFLVSTKTLYAEKGLILSYYKNKKQ